MAKLNGIALSAAGAGALFLLSGIRGGGVLANLRNLIQGKPPADTGANPIDTSGGTAASGLAGTEAPPVAGKGYVGPRKAYQALRAAGFSQSAAIMMTAIGGVESGWDTHALNDTPATGDLSVGVWQINYYGSLAAARTPLFGSWQDLLAGGVQKQADAAFTLYQASGFGPWQPDITSGKVLAFMSQAQAAAGGK